MNSRNFLKSSLLALGLLLAHAAPGHAQEAKEKPALVRFTVWGNWAGKDLYVKRPGSSSKPDEGFLKLDLLDLGYSAAVPFLRASPLELCTPLEKEGETIWQALVTVTIPAGVREPLVMIFPNDDGGARSSVFDLDPAVFPYGGYQLVNLSKLPILAMLDEAVIRIKPGASGHFKGTGKPKQNVWLRMAAEYTEKNSKVIYSSMMRNRDDKRMFMFCHSTDASPDTPVSVRTLVDFARQAPEQ